MYCAYVTRIRNLRKHTNADRLLCGECFGNTVIVDLGTDPDQLGVYFPTDGKLGLEFAQKNDLLRRKDENGAPAGGYLDPEKRNIKALKLRGEKSDGLFLPLSCLASFKVFHDIKGNPTEIAHFYHHERVGAYDSFCYTGDLSPNQRLTVALLIRWHMWPYAVEKSDNPSKTVSKIKRLLGNDIWNQVMVLNACDRNAH